MGLPSREHLLEMLTTYLYTIASIQFDQTAVGPRICVPDMSPGVYSHHGTRQYHSLSVIVLLYGIH